MKKLIYSKEDLDLILTLELEEKDKEIERLNNKIKDISEQMNEQINFKTENANEIIRLNNIINKAIEYMQNIHWFDLRNNEGLQLYGTTENFYNDLSNILRGSDNY